MATISNLTTSFLNLPDSEAYALIRHLRELRRMLPPKPEKKVKTAKKNPKKVTQTLDMMMDMMTPEQTQALLEKLQNKGT